MDGRDDLTSSQAHLGLEELAELDAGLLLPAEAAAARAHLVGCAACATELKALAEVSALLATAGDVPMPADVVLRIEAALGDEARRRAAGSDVSAAAEPRRARASAAAAASPAVTAGSAPDRPPATHGSATSTPESAAPLGSAPAIDLDAVRARRERSTRLRRGAAALVGVAAVLGGGYLFGDTLLSAADLTSAGGEDSADSAAEGATSSDTGGAEAPVAAGSDNAYTSAHLPEDVARLLERPNAPVAPVPSSARGLEDDGADRGADTSRCVDAIAARADSAGQPLAVDVGTFDGVPAVIVVLSVPPSDDVAQVWVVSDTCLLPDSTGVEVLDRVTLSELPAAE